MSERTRARIALVLVAVIGAVVVAAMLDAVDVLEQSELDARSLSIGDAVYVVAPPVTAAAVSVPTISAPTTEPAPTRGGPVAAVTPSATATRGTQVQATPTDPPPPSTVPMWAGPIPVYGNRGGCTIENATIITARFAARGASRDTQEWALRMVSRETGCDTSKRNRNERTRDDSYGICQLNARSGHFGPNGILSGWDRDRLLVDLVYAADACAHMWTVCSRGPWTPPYSCTTPSELR